MTLRARTFAVPALATALAFGAAPVQPPQAGMAPGMRVEGAPSVQGVVYSIFDNSTGARTGRLKIDRVDFEYRRRGFMMVAWQPQVVLRGVELEIGADLAWSTQGGQILRALCTHGSRDNLSFRDVRLRLAGPAPQELVAAEGRITATGALELIHAGAVAADGTRAGDATYLLPLTGPQAGQLRCLVSAPSHTQRDDLLTAATQE